MILKTSSMGKRHVYYVQKSYRNEDGKPREVGGACRIQVLATVRTQETAGGPNGATRSEFRRCCLTVDVTLV